MKGLVYFCLGAAAGAMLTKCTTPTTESYIIENRSDTIFIRDTVKIAELRSVETSHIRHDTIRIPSDRLKIAVNSSQNTSDTNQDASLSPGDTVLFPIPISQLHYSDSLADVWVSGYAPHLDSLHIYPLTRTINTTITHREPAKCPRWHLGITTGVTATASGLRPGIAIGVTYSIKSW